MAKAKKKDIKVTPKLGFYQVSFIPVQMGGCSTRAWTSIQTCCGTCCC